MAKVKKQIRYKKLCRKSILSCKKGNSKINRKKNLISIICKCHKEFLDYQQITDKLNNLLRSYPNVIQVEVIGYSKGNKPIYMTLISNDSCNTPKNAVFIEAGCCGDDIMAVATCMYIIDYLCRNECSNKALKIMDFMIVPCTNPDSYQSILYGKGKSRINLSTSFPVSLDKNSVDSIDMDQFLEAAKEWKESFQFYSPEKSALVRTIDNYKFSIKLFISLQEKGEKIVYPFGTTNQNVRDVADLRHVARKGKLGTAMPFEIGSIYDEYGLVFGTIIDFLKLFASSLKFTYIIHMNNKKKKQLYSEVPYRAENVLSCITSMVKEIKEYYKGEKKDPVPPKQIQFINKDVCAE